MDDSKVASCRDGWLQRVADGQARARMYIIRVNGLYLSFFLSKPGSNARLPHT